MSKTIAIIGFAQSFAAFCRLRSAKLRAFLCETLRELTLGDFCVSPNLCKNLQPRPEQRVQRRRGVGGACYRQGFAGRQGGFVFFAQEVD